MIALGRLNVDPSESHTGLNHGDSDRNDRDPDLILAQRVAPKQSGFERMIHSRWSIFVLLFGVLGALGVPLLWLSREFSRREKIRWKIVVVIYTFVLVAIASLCVGYAWRQWQMFQGF